MLRIESARDLLLRELVSAMHNLHETIANISSEEYDWEPLSPSEQAADCLLPPERKRVWRVFQQEGHWTYDYTPEALDPPPFTTIAWIINHIAQTADMYLFCIQSEKAEGIERTWDDLPVPSNFAMACKYLDEVLAVARGYLLSFPQQQIDEKLNKLTPAPWGEMRPTYVNLWGGVIEHLILHTMQIAARKDTIRYGF